ncbi:hypothetical protein ACH5RR_021491 [Cinchona calisaya]|uniref:Uncharacterized protein n=1 Tax=Cinchona calisaya TaxID=153742 RepID=A0ABD2ZKB7_9GENT
MKLNDDAVQMRNQYVSIAPNRLNTFLGTLSVPNNQLDEYIVGRIDYDKNLYGCLLIRESHEQFLRVNIQHVDLSFAVQATFTYAKCVRIECMDLWNNLRHLSASLRLDKAWLWGGEFNVISSLSEYVGRASQCQGTIDDFKLPLQIVE